MAVYFVTGKLGGGKSLMSVARIQDCLNRGAPVATNIDLNLKNMLGPAKKNTRVYRIPDKPCLEDLEMIGIGNKTYDESNNGLLVLDECGTWFNSRSWGDKTRQGVINWFLHARKLGWDIIFLVQDISIVDKQARLALAEHVVYCRRMDRVTIPFIGFFYKLFTGSKLPLPKLHMGIVKYGDQQNSMKVDTWSCFGITLYSAYDTKQAFSDNYDSGVYSYLPPYYTHGRYAVPKTIRNIMRITKIYLRKWSRPVCFMLGASLMGGYGLLTAAPAEELPEIETLPELTLADLYQDYRIVSFTDFPAKPPFYRLVDSEGNSIDSSDFRREGLYLYGREACELVISKGDDSVTLTCS